MIVCDSSFPTGLGLKDGRKESVLLCLTEKTKVEDRTIKSILQVGLLNIDIELSPGHESGGSLHPSCSADGQPANLKAAEGLKEYRPQKEQHTACNSFLTADMIVHLSCAFTGSSPASDEWHYRFQEQIRQPKNSKHQDSLFMQQQEQLREAAQDSHQLSSFDPLWGISPGEAGKKEKRTEFEWKESKKKGEQLQRAARVPSRPEAY